MGLHLTGTHSKTVELLFYTLPYPLNTFQPCISNNRVQHTVRTPNVNASFKPFVLEIFLWLLFDKFYT